MTAPLLLFVLAQAGSPAPAACLSVAGDAIRNADLARAVPEFRGLDPEARAGFAPLPGARRVFTPQEIAALARRDGLDLPRPPAGVCFERPMMTLTREQVEQALLDALGPDASAAGKPAPIEMDLVDFSQYPVPAGRIEFPLGGLSYPPRGDSSVAVEWLGRILYGDHRTAGVWARVRLKTIRPVLVAAGPLSAGSLVEPAQVRTEPRSVFPFPAAAALAAADAVGRVPRRSVAAGEAITAALLAEAPSVRRGDLVAVRYEDGGLVLRFSAIAGSTGLAGDPVVVENPETHVKLRGVVAGRSSVVVHGLESEGK